MKNEDRALLPRHGGVHMTERETLFTLREPKEADT
jgi:hypothetical protein